MSLSKTSFASKSTQRLRCKFHLGSVWKIDRTMLKSSLCWCIFLPSVYRRYQIVYKTANRGRSILFLPSKESDFIRSSMQAIRPTEEASKCFSQPEREEKKIEGKASVQAAARSAVQRCHLERCPLRLLWGDRPWRRGMQVSISLSLSDSPAAA